MIPEAKAVKLTNNGEHDHQNQLLSTALNIKKTGYPEKRYVQVLKQYSNPPKQIGKSHNTIHIFLPKNKYKKILVSSKNVAIFAPQIQETNLLCIYL